MLMGLPFMGAEAVILLGMDEARVPGPLGAAQDRRAHPGRRATAPRG